MKGKVVGGWWNCGCVVCRWDEGEDGKDILVVGSERKCNYKLSISQVWQQSNFGHKVEFRYSGIKLSLMQRIALSYVVLLS